jgi:hypothetical protein
VRHNIIDKYAADDGAWIAEQDFNVIGAGPLRGPHDLAATPAFSPDWRPDGMPSDVGARASPAN